MDRLRRRSCTIIYVYFFCSISTKAIREVRVKCISTRCINLSLFLYVKRFIMNNIKLNWRPDLPDQSPSSPVIWVMLTSRSPRRYTPTLRSAASPKLKSTVCTALLANDAEPPVAAPLVPVGKLLPPAVALARTSAPAQFRDRYEGFAEEWLRGGGAQVPNIELQVGGGDSQQQSSLIFN